MARKETTPPAQEEAELHLGDEGMDELNLAEFPLAVLSQRVPEGAKTLVFQSTVAQGRQEVTRKLTVTGSDLHGLPTSMDEDLLVGLITISKSQGFADREVSYTRSGLLKLLGWPNSGQSYDRLAQSIRRWHAVTLQYERAWYDRDARRWVDASFHVLESFTLPSKAAPRDQTPRGEVVCTFTWNDWILRSFRSGNIKKLDLTLYFQLSLAPAKRMYRYLDKQFWHSDRLDFDLKDFAAERVGLSRDYDVGKIKEKLGPSLEELERAGFLAPLSREERYRKLGRGNWRIVFQRALAPGRAETAAEDLSPTLLACGVSPRTAAELVMSFPAERIREKIAVFDAIKRQGGHGIKNLPGYLVASIRDDFAPPRGLSLKKAPPKTAPTRQQPLPLSGTTEEKPSEAALYLASLPKDEQERMKAEALAGAKPWVLSHYERHRTTRPDLAKHFLQVMVEQHVAKTMAKSPDGARRG